MVTTEDLRQAITGHGEWLLVRGSGRSFPVLSHELEISEQGKKRHFAWLDDGGCHLWRLKRADLIGSEISLDIASTFGRAAETLRLVPRTPAAESMAELACARLEKANEIAALIKYSLPSVKLRRVALNVENGRLAQVEFDRQDQTTAAALADITSKVSPEIILTLAVRWLDQVGQRKKNPVKTLYVVCEERQAKACQKLLALLTRFWRERLSVWKIDRRCEPPSLIELPRPQMQNLWRAKAPKLVLPASPAPSDTAQRIVDLSADDIDVLFSRHGETLRFNGLPFARVRRVMGQERVWFGIGRNLRLLMPDNRHHLVELIEHLQHHRTGASPNRRHMYYRASPEAWLESILRRNIQLLDGNLILSPLYNQFRSSNDKIDLLALRRDGRLVIIELKTQPDRAGVFQAADYWRKIELQRRRGILSAANLFDGREIMDKPAMVYFVAPAWSFHREFEFFARCLAPEIELWRFELHQEWRGRVRVLSRVNYDSLTNL